MSLEVLLAEGRAPLPPVRFRQEVHILIFKILIFSIFIPLPLSSTTPALAIRHVGVNVSVSAFLIAGEKTD